MNPALRTLAFLAALASATATAAIRMVPEVPFATQDVLLSVDLEVCVADNKTTVEVAGNRITIGYAFSACFVGLRNRADVTVRVPTAGRYEVAERRTTGTDTSAPVVLGHVEFATPAQRPATSFDGMWYDPAEPGWGVSITEGESGQLFVAWYLFGAGVTGNLPGQTLSTWFFASGGTWTSSNEFVATLYFSSGGTPFGSHEAGSLRVGPAGTVTLKVQPDGRLLFTAQLAQVPPIIRTLSRYRF